MNLQQLFTMDAKTARRFLDRWNAWVQVCDLGPMKRLAKTIMAKAEGILRSIATGLPTASSKPSTATCRPPSARPKATEPSEISKPSSTSSPETFWPIHPLEIATSHITAHVQTDLHVARLNRNPQFRKECGDPASLTRLVNVQINQDIRTT